jgi:hypothetical protein
MIIPFHARPGSTSARKPMVPHALEVWALTGDYSSFSLLYSFGDAPDAPAFFAGVLFDQLAGHTEKSVRHCELAIWADVMPLDARRWMFYITSHDLSKELLAVLSGLAKGVNGWSPVGRVPTLPESAGPLYEYKKGERSLLLSDVQVGEGEKALAHPMVNCTKTGLSLGFGVFPEGYLNENKLYLGTGGGICFKTKSARSLRPKKVYCLVQPGKCEPPESGGAGLKLV